MRRRRHDFRTTVVYAIGLASIATAVFFMINAGINPRARPPGLDDVNPSTATSGSFMVLGAFHVIAILFYVEDDTPKVDGAATDPHDSKKPDSFTGFIRQPWYKVLSVGTDLRGLLRSLDIRSGTRSPSFREVRERCGATTRRRQRLPSPSSSCAGPAPISDSHSPPSARRSIVTCSVSPSCRGSSWPSSPSLNRPRLHRPPKQPTESALTMAAIALPFDPAHRHR